MAKKRTSKQIENSPRQRLQRVLASAGVGSRRECEKYIVEGRVEVDGEIVVELGTQVDPEKQKIYFDGTLLKRPRKQYFMLNKPSGVVSTNRDAAGRLSVVEMINTDQRIFHVGRLDKSSEGLILLTNDGDLANKLTHPRFGVEKTYLVRIAGRPHINDLKQLTDGVHLAEGYAKVSRLKVKKRIKAFTDLELVLDEGRNREIRRLLARIGHKVLTLKRIAIGPLRLGELPIGMHRRLTNEEVKLLENVASGTGGRKKRSRKQTGRKTTGSKHGTKSRSSIHSSDSTSRRPAKKRPTKKKTVRGKKSPATAGGRGRMSVVPKTNSKQRTSKSKNATRKNSKTKPSLKKPVSKPSKKRNRKR